MLAFAMFSRRVGGLFVVTAAVTALACNGGASGGGRGGGAPGGPGGNTATAGGHAGGAATGGQGGSAGDTASGGNGGTPGSGVSGHVLQTGGGMSGGGEHGGSGAFGGLGGGPTAGYGGDVGPRGGMDGGAGSAGVSASAGGGGAGGQGGVGGSADVVLYPDDTGWVDGSSNELGVQGAFYPFSDGVDDTGTSSNGICEQAGHRTYECSMVYSPPPGSPTGFPPRAFTSEMCTSGILAKVIDSLTSPGTLDYDHIFGGGIAFDLNSPGMGSSVKLPFDATAKGVTGVAFDVDVIPTTGLRVEFTAQTDTLASGPAYWPATPLFAPAPVIEGTNRINWGDVRGPTGYPFDPTSIQSIRFHVPSSPNGVFTYTFCIGNLTLLTK